MELRQFAAMAEMAAAAKPAFKLQYFGVMAKGLGIALVAEHSGLSWLGSADTATNVDYKAKAPFGQLPLLLLEGAPPIAQTTAILNVLGRLCGLAGDDDRAFALSQMLIGEAEDLYAGLQRFNPTVYQALGSGFPKADTRAQYDAFWARDVPKQMVFLQNFCLSDNLGIAFLNAEERKAVGWTGPAPTPTVGELYLWSILHQMVLVQPTCLDATHVLKNFYSIVLKSASTARVLSGESPMGPFKPYFVVPE